MPPTSYRVEKDLAMRFWTQPGQRFCSCAVCLTESRPLQAALCLSEPEAHHLIVPKGRGVAIDEAWNLVPTHTGCHGDKAHGGMRGDLIAAFCGRVGMMMRLGVLDQIAWRLHAQWQLHPRWIEPTADDLEAGRRWLAHRVESLGLKQTIDLDCEQMFALHTSKIHDILKGANQ